MREQRLIDANELHGIENLLNTDIIQGSKEASWLMDQVLHDIDAMPTIDPETLPIVRELRAELERTKKEQEEKFEMYLPAMEKFVVNGCPKCGKKPKVLASLDYVDIVDKIFYTVTRTAACEKCGISADLDAWNRLSWRGDDDQG